MGDEKVSATRKVASKINVKTYHLTRTLYGEGNSRNRFYEKKIINKSNGKIRTIHAVKSYLKTIQKKTLEYLSDNYVPTTYAYGFVKGKSIIKNAKIHRNKKLILKIDLKDFFPSISFARVMGMFQKYPFNFDKDVAVIFAQICCLDNNGELPQGGVTSPYISNMICRRLDSRLSKLARVKRIDYSRYADDMIFSTNNNLDFDNFLKIVTEIINEEGFEINDSKTKLLKKSNRQIVSGVVVNNGLNVNRKYINNIRALLHNCYENGVSQEMTRNHFKDTRNTCSPLFKSNEDQYVLYKKNRIVDKKEAKRIFLNHIYGRIQFVGQIAKANEKLNNKHYHTRMRIYNNLIEKFQKVCIKEKIRGSQYHHTQKELASNRNIELINRIKNMTIIKELEEILKVLQNEDPRFFVKSFNTSDFTKFKKEILNLLDYPSFNQKVLTTLLSYLTDSTSILGGLCHDLEYKPLLQKDIMKFIENFLTKFKYKLAYQPRKTFKIFLDRTEKRIINLSPSRELNLFADENFKTEIAIPFKKKTRFGLDDTSTDLNIMIKQACSDATIKYEIENNNVRSFYTYVPAIQDSIKLIITSMERHSRSEKLIISVVRDKNNKLILISISDNNRDEIEMECSRDVIAHGKMRSVINILNGIGNYYFIANFKNKGWMKINLMKGDSIEKHEEMFGVTHLITLPEI